MYDVVLAVALVHVVHGALRLAGVAAGDHGGDVCAGGEVVLKDLVQVDVDGHVAVGQQDVLLLDVGHVAAQVGQSLNAALGVAGAGLLGEGGQQPEAAAFAGQVPILAGLHMVQQGLIVLLKHQAHIGDAGVGGVGEHEVDETIASAVGHGGHGANGGQLVQIGLIIGPIGENNRMKVGQHYLSPPFFSG